MSVEHEAEENYDIAHHSHILGDKFIIIILFLLFI